MAGFSIDIGDEGAGYEKAVNMPSSSTSAAAVAGTVKIADGIFKVLDQYDKATKASGPTDSSIKRAAYGKLAQAVNATKGQSPLNTRTAVTSAIVEYTNAGFEIGQAEKDLVNSATGINIDYLGFDPNQAAIDGALEAINNNKAFLLSAKDELDAKNKPYTNTELLQTAIQKVQKVESATLYIANSQVIDQADFQRNYMPQARTLISDLRSKVLLGLQIEADEGKSIMPENLVNLEVELANLDGFIKSKIPAGLPTDVSKPLFDDIEVLRGQLDILKNFDKKRIDAKSLDLINRNTEVLLDFVEKNVDNPIVAKAMVSGDFDVTDLVLGQITNLKTSLNNLDKEDLEYVDLFTFAPPEAASEVSGNKIEAETGVKTTLLDNNLTSIHDVEEIEKAENRSMTKRKDAIFFASLERVNRVDPSSMNRPEHRDNFLGGVGHATINISTSPEIFKTDTLTQIYNEQTYKSLEIIDQLDPTQATVARARLADGLKAQLNLVSTAVSGSDQGSYFKVTGLGEIQYDLESRVDTGMIRMDKSVLPLVKGYASKHYNGDVTSMVADRGRRLETLERSQIEDAGFKFITAYGDYKKVLKNSNRKKFYIKHMKRLGLSTGDIEQSLIREIEQTEQKTMGTLRNPWQIFWSDKTDTDEKLFLSIEKGEYYTDINGDVRVKN
jgi:hypothetical protein